MTTYPMKDRAAKLCVEAKLRAFDLLDGARGDVAVVNLAANMLAEYAARLEAALGGRVAAPWDPAPLDRMEGSGGGLAEIAYERWERFEERER